MSDSQGTFSESWYRIRDRRVALRPHVRIHRQMYRGEPWYVLHDPFGHQFFRLRPAVYEFVVRLGADRTVAEVWQACLERFPDEAPGQQEVIQLLAQLFYANLIQSDSAADSAKLFDRFRKRRRKEVGKRLLTIMFARFHVLDPDRYLVRMLPLVRPFMSSAGWVVWTLVVLLGLKAVADNAGEFVGRVQGVLAPGNLVLLYIALVILKTLHEFGHAFACRRYGGEVHDMGIMLLVFTPLPYVNATAAWAFRERSKRIVVGASGMIVEVFVAAVAAIVWASTGPGTVNAVAYNTVLVASVSTIVFNANPLLRFDGYYILSDLLDVPNLHRRAGQAWRYWVERRLFGMRESVAVERPSATRLGTFGLATFGAMAFIYRIFVFGGILLFVGNRFLLLGMIMAAFCIVAWGIAPIIKLARYLVASPSLHRVRARAVAVVVVLVGAVVLLLGAVPFRVAVIAPGMLKAADHSVVSALTPGALTQVLAPPGVWVEEGTPLVQLVAPELDFSIAAARAQMDEVEARLRQARETFPANLHPLTSALVEVRSRVGELERQREELTIRARHPGIWSAPALESSIGSWFERGHAIGSVTDPRVMVFHAVISQTDASRMFSEPMIRSMVRLRGESDVNLAVNRMEVFPGERTTLPGMAVGWQGGGEVAVDVQDSSGLRATEPFYEVRTLLNHGDSATLYHGRTGRIVFIYKSEPLLKQWLRQLRQLVQKRYQV